MTIEDELDNLSDWLAEYPYTIKEAAEDEKSNLKKLFEVIAKRVEDLKRKQEFLIRAKQSPENCYQISVETQR